MAFYISGPKLLFETTENSTHPNSTQQESNYIYIYTTKFGTSIKIRLNRKFDSTEFETMRVDCIYNIHTLSVNIKFICTSFRNRQNSEPLASFSGLFRSEYKLILYLTTMYVFCVYPAMSKKSENLSDLNKKDRNKCHSSPFINVVKGVFFVVRATLVPVSYLSAPSTVHSYRVPGKFIRRLKSLFV